MHPEQPFIENTATGERLPPPAAPGDIPRGWVLVMPTGWKLTQSKGAGDAS